MYTYIVMGEGEIGYLNELKQALADVEVQIIADEKEKIEILNRFPVIDARKIELNEIVDVLVYKRDSLEVLLSEIDKGFDKVQASVKSLYLLALSKSKILKRKYSNLHKI